MASFIQPLVQFFKESLVDAVPARQKTGLRGALIKAIHTVVRWRQRAKERKQLAKLPPYILKDIGLTEADRYREMHKHFWED